MFTINGADYTIFVVPIMSFILLFALQFFLCRRVKSKILKCLPWGYVVFQLVLSVMCLFEDTGGFIDLRSLFFLLFLGYAAVCAAGIGLGWLFGRSKAK